MGRGIPSRREYFGHLSWWLRSSTADERKRRKGRGGKKKTKKRREEQEQDGEIGYVRVLFVQDVDVVSTPPRS